MWRRDDPQGHENQKIKWHLVPFTRGRGLDLGCGPQKTFPHFIGVDNGHHAQAFGWNIKPDMHVETCEDLGVFASQSMDFVFSSHLLEHIQDTKKTLKEWWRTLKVGGYLCLYLPHKDFYPNIGTEGSNPDHKHDFLPIDIERQMPAGWDLLINEERNEGTEYSFFQVYKKLSGSKNRWSHKEPKPKKTVGICRYGAFGDVLQASSLFPGLKSQGYHVSVYTTPRAAEIIKHDPYVDELCLQDQDQVPNVELGEYWAHLEKKHDKFINLSESVEGTLLALPGRTNHAWPQDVRHKYMNTNYLEFAHDLAGVHFSPRQKFYPSELEQAWAKKEKAKHGKVILWSLSGSAVHKTWPHLDQVLARLLLKTDYKIALVGDDGCRLLEQGWENEPRILKRSGIWSIRESLAFAQVANLVVGPETGVLNAVGMEEVPKVVTLSHSSVENLTKHWKNTISLSQPTDSNVPCAKSACHLMHYGFEFCHRDLDPECPECKTSTCTKHTGVAKCQVNITPDMMYDAIMHWIKEP